MLVVILAAFPYLFQLNWLSQPRATAVCVVMFYHLVTFAMQENIDQRYVIKFCVKLNNSTTETFASLSEFYGDATLSRTVILSGTKLSKRAEKVLKTTIVLEDQNLVNK